MNDNDWWMNKEKKMERGGEMEIGEVDINILGLLIPCYSVC